MIERRDIRVPFLHRLSERAHCRWIGRPEAQMCVQGLAVITPIPGGRILGLTVITAGTKAHPEQDAAAGVVLAELFQKPLNIFVLISIEDTRNVVADMMLQALIAGMFGRVIKPVRKR